MGYYSQQVMDNFYILAKICTNKYICTVKMGLFLFLSKYAGSSTLLNIRGHVRRFTAVFITKLLVENAQPHMLLC